MEADVRQRARDRVAQVTLQQFLVALLRRAESDAHVRVTAHELGRKLLVEFLEQHGCGILHDELYAAGLRTGDGRGGEQSGAGKSGASGQGGHG